MASIVLSFVGHQDPDSDKTKEEGSIVTLLRHLISQKNQVKKVLLLYTQDMQYRAELTQEWLESEAIEGKKFTKEDVILIPVKQQLSEDPVNLLLASEEARRGIELAKADLSATDILELNASSGTPVMKSAWSILQAAGYGKNSRVWQVRNPKEQKPGQDRVFQSNVDTLRKEFDRQIIEELIGNYDYSAALTIFQSSSLPDNGLKILLEYGNLRLNRNFNKARQIISPFRQILGNRLSLETDKLVSGEQIAVITELYFHICDKLNIKKYADFLVLAFAFQEVVLRYLVIDTICPELLDKSWDESESMLIMNIQQTELKGHLKANSNHIDRYVLIKILENHRPLPSCWSNLMYLNTYSQERNDFIHQFGEVNEIKNIQEIKGHMKAILSYLTTNSVPKESPFDVLNQQIRKQLYDFPL